MVVVALAARLSRSMARFSAALLPRCMASLTIHSLATTRTIARRPARRLQAVVVARCKRPRTACLGRKRKLVRHVDTWSIEWSRTSSRSQNRSRSLVCPSLRSTSMVISVHFCKNEKLHYSCFIWYSHSSQPNYRPSFGWCCYGRSRWCKRPSCSTSCIARRCSKCER